MDSEVIMAIDSKEEKDAICRQFVQYMFDRTNEMFKWNGLPDTIPQRVIELPIQNNGYIKLKFTKNYCKRE